MDGLGVGIKMTHSCDLNERHLGVWMIKFEIGSDD